MKLLVAFVALVSAVPTLAQIFREGSCPDVPMMSSLNITRYLGKWYEIEKFPNIFQSNTGMCGRAQYSMLDNGRIEVINRNIDENGKVHTATGDAYVPDPKVPGVLSVHFKSNPSPRRGEYRVVETDYTTYSLVTSCHEIPYKSQHMEYAWILSRQLTLSKTEVDRLKALIGGKDGFDVSKFITTDQTDCPL